MSQPIASIICCTNENSVDQSKYRSELVFGLELPKISFKLVGHGKGVNAGDVAAVLELDDLAQILQ